MLRLEPRPAPSRAMSYLAPVVALGITVVFGTLLFAVTVGPNAQFWLERLDLGHAPGFDPDLDPEVDPDPTLAAG